MTKRASTQADSVLTGKSETNATVDDRILQRIRGEFLEMPGLRLTVAQARRLWALDERSCVELLDRLVQTQFLRRPDRDGAYSRVSDGPAEFRRMRAAAAGEDDRRTAT